jgi:uncharacterized membrane protein
MQTSTPSEPTTQDRDRDRDALVRQAELIISNVLRGGVLLSGAIILIGVVIFYVRYQSGRTVQYQTYPHTLATVGQQLAQGKAVAIIMLGLLILLATPVMRVAVSIVAFMLERDWRYVVITTIVLAILLTSFFALGQGGV